MHKPLHLLHEKKRYKAKYHKKNHDFYLKFINVEGAVHSV